MSVHLEEFLFRGRPVGSEQSVAWHVVLAETGTDGFGQPFVRLTGALTPEQAKALGYGLSDVLADINTSALADADTMREAVKTETAAKESAEDTTRLYGEEIERLQVLIKAETDAREVLADKLKIANESVSALGKERDDLAKKLKSVESFTPITGFNP